MYKNWLGDHKCHYQQEVTNGQISSAWSYLTRIVQTVQGLDGSDLRIGNVTHYGRVTARHQRQANVTQCDIKVTGVPEGTTDLLPFIGK